MMVTKIVKKLTSMMMGLLILILLRVHANDLAPTKFYMSSPPISLPYSSRIDEAKRPIKRLMHNCLAKVVKACELHKKTWPLADLRYQICISEGFGKCFIHVINGEYSRMFRDCIMTEGNRILAYGSKARVSCLLDCYEQHMKMHSDVIQMQNP
jgi:hypothetical protein